MKYYFIVISSIFAAIKYIIRNKNKFPVRVCSLLTRIYKIKRELYYRLIKL